MKVVLDTNILVAAGFNPRSSSAEIVRAVKAGELEMIWNQATRAESKHILKQIPPLLWPRFERLFAPEGEFTRRTHPERFKQIEDPDDRKFAALAAAADAVLISNDEHLLAVRDQLDVRVQTPTEMVQQARGGRP